VRLRVQLEEHRLLLARAGRVGARVRVLRRGQVAVDGDLGAGGGWERLQSAVRRRG